MEYRRKWARNWDQVKYCSDACRGRRGETVDPGLELVIVELLETRAAGSTICPSEAARAHSPEDWRSIMEPARDAARRLAARGVVEVRQKGRVIDPSAARGPIRLGRGPRWSARGEGLG